MGWYLEVWRKYAVFEGRARRKEYWFFVLFHTIFAVCLMVIDSFAGTFDEESGYGVFSGIYYLAALIPGLAVTVRRLHDTGRSGWWILVILVPLLGPIVLLVFAASDSQSGENRFGPNPKMESGSLDHSGRPEESTLPS
jgi:uncharacterized membrane protein YhaH (DUF805 family)